MKKDLNSNPKISIIIPVYCVEAYLRRCLDSVLAQSYTDWECILVDDGSTDNSGAICDDFSRKDSRFRVIHKSNEGVSSARNVGLGVAMGEWIVFVDSDDTIESNMLQDIHKYAKVYQDVDLFSWGFTYINEDASSKIVLFDEKKSNAMNLFRYRFQDGIAFYAYKRSLLFQWNIIFPEGIRFSEDQCFTCKYLLNNPVCYIINKAYYNYYYREGSACSMTKTLNDYADNLRVAVEIAKYANARKCTTVDFVHSIISRFFNSFLWYLIRLESYDHKLAVALYRDAYREIVRQNFGFFKNVRLLLCYFLLNRYIKHLKQKSNNHVKIT